MTCLWNAMTCDMLHIHGTSWLIPDLSLAIVTLMPCSAVSTLNFFLPNPTIELSTVCLPKTLIAFLTLAAIFVFICVCVCICLCVCICVSPRLLLPSRPWPQFLFLFVFVFVFVFVFPQDSYCLLNLGRNLENCKVCLQHGQLRHIIAKIAGEIAIMELGGIPNRDTAVDWGQKTPPQRSRSYSR